MAIMGFSSLSVLFLCAYFDDRFSFAAIGAGIIILLLTLFIRKFRERVTPFFIAAALIFSGVSFEVLSDYKISYADSLTDKESVIEATILDEPEFKHSQYYYTLKTESVDGEDFDVKLWLSASQYINAEPYDKIKLKVHIYEIGSFSSDIKLYYHSKGISSVAMSAITTIIRLRLSGRKINRWLIIFLNSERLLKAEFLTSCRTITGELP